VDDPRWAKLLSLLAASRVMFANEMAACPGAHQDLEEATSGRLAIEQAKGVIAQPVVFGVEQAIGVLERTQMIIVPPLVDVADLVAANVMLITGGSSVRARGHIPRHRWPSPEWHF
jgi:hypothetical protein